MVSGDIKGVFIMYFETSELSGGNAESDRVPRTKMQVDPAKASPVNDLAFSMPHYHHYFIINNIFFILKKE